MRKAIFLDRDGVINKIFIKIGLPFSPPSFDQLKILPGVKESILRLKRLNFLCLVVTNQPDVSRGKIEKPLPKPTYLNGNVIDLHPYLNDPYWEIETPTSNDDEAKFSREGIMRLASVEEDMDRDFYGRLLSPIYKKDYLENLPINELKELFDQYLRDMSIG